MHPSDYDSNSMGSLEVEHFFEMLGPSNQSCTTRAMRENPWCRFRGYGPSVLVVGDDWAIVSCSLDIGDPRSWGIRSVRARRQASSDIPR